MRGHLTRGTLVVVGGHSRGVGKTALIEHLLRTAREPWVAIKISAHRHAANGGRVPLIEEARAATPRTQAARCLAAGAARAFLVRAPDAALPRAAAFIASLRAGGTNVIVESNRIADFVTPDRVWFVVAPHIADWKASSARVLRCASVLEGKWGGAYARYDFHRVRGVSRICRPGARAGEAADRAGTDGADSGVGRDRDVPRVLFTVSRQAR